MFQNFCGQAEPEPQSRQNQSIFTAARIPVINSGSSDFSTSTCWDPVSLILNSDRDPRPGDRIIVEWSGWGAYEVIVTLAESSRTLKVRSCFGDRSFAGTVAFDPSLDQWRWPYFPAQNDVPRAPKCEFTVALVAFIDYSCIDCRATNPHGLHGCAIGVLAVEFQGWCSANDVEECLVAQA